jgi:hypothetical protein
VALEGAPNDKCEFDNIVNGNTSKYEDDVGVTVRVSKQLCPGINRVSTYGPVTASALETPPSPLAMVADTWE